MPVIGRTLRVVSIPEPLPVLHQYVNQLPELMVVVLQSNLPYHPRQRLFRLQGNPGMILFQNYSPCSCLSCALPSVQAGREPHCSLSALYPAAHLRSPAVGRVLRFFHHEFFRYLIEITIRINAIRINTMITGLV